MKQDSYPVTRRLWRALRRVALSAFAFALLIVAVEVIRIAFMLRRIHPWMGYAFFAFIALAALFVMLRALSWRAGRKLLCPPVVPASHKARFKDLKFFVQHFIARLIQLPSNYGMAWEMSAAPEVRQVVNVSEQQRRHPITQSLLQVCGGRLLVRIARPSKWHSQSAKDTFLKTH